jgi:hypothetical protein
MDTILGLPLHALVVHVSVILVPLAAAGHIVTGWRQKWRSSYALPLLLLALAGAAAAVLATQSGEALQSHIRTAAAAAGARARFGDHPEEGETARNFALLFAATVAAFWGLDRWGERLSIPGWTRMVVYSAASGVGLVAITTIVIAGHSGAALVWKDLGNFVRPS